MQIIFLVASLIIVLLVVALRVREPGPEVKSCRVCGKPLASSDGSECSYQCSLTAAALSMPAVFNCSVPGCGGRVARENVVRLDVDSGAIAIVHPCLECGALYSWDGSRFSFAGACYCLEEGGVPTRDPTVSHC